MNAISIYMYIEKNHFHCSIFKDIPLLIKGFADHFAVGDISFMANIVDPGEMCFLGFSLCSSIPL